ncbi:hypothetical protein B7494_g2587 [Chlorociboria aeruginascens]|nr:hypothetical protein B7494_g2587 [Chlorociboria aeruginascens]
MAPQAPWQVIAQRKQAERQSRIPEEWLLSNLPSPSTLNVLSIPRTSSILTSQELSITENYDATSLAETLRAGKLTAVEVTIAFCKRAAIAQQLCNCLTEIFFTKAIERAKYLDQEYIRTGKTIGPLHGVPVSLKDTFKVKGYDTSIGIASLAENPARENALLVDILLEQGAVLYCKTNIPQTLAALDSDNNVFGRVLNPRNRMVTAGGSSGGEGALIAMRGSILGVGTDIGGSIRVPAMCNGLYGIKPSNQRVPYVGQEDGTIPGTSSLSLIASAGPIATSIRDCELFLRTVSSTRPWERDPNVAYGFWEEQGSISKKPLIGIIRTDGIVSPLPPIQKILDETVDALEKSGINVVEINNSAFQKCQSIINGFFAGTDGGKSMFALLDRTGEPLINWLNGRMKKKSPISVSKLVELHARRIAVATEMLNVWKDPKTGRQIDAIICPVAPHPVPPIDRWNSVNYTSSFVLMDYPAGSLPIRDFTEADLKGDLPDATPLNGWDKVNRELWDEKTIDRKVYLNTMLSIQLVCPKLQERRLYLSMKIIDDVFRNGKTLGQAVL